MNGCLKFAVSLGCKARLWRPSGGRLLTVKAAAPVRPGVADLGVDIEKVATGSTRPLSGQHGRFVDDAPDFAFQFVGLLC